MIRRVEVVPDRDWAGRAAEALAARLRDRPHARLCLPTGDTPRPVYRALVELARRGEAPFDGAELIALDEYLGLPPDDPARADVSLRRDLIDALSPGPAAFHAIDADAPDPEAEARRHDAVAAEGIDLAVLGLGVNGHVGLNEPGSPADSPTRVVTLAAESRAVATGRYGASAPPTRGITLGLGRLLAAREVWLLVAGAHKAAPLARAIVGPEGSDCPASFLRRHPRYRVFADASAAALLDA